MAIVKNANMNKLQAKSPEFIFPAITQVQAAYIAGIIDGEGYIGIQRGTKGTYHLRVAVTSVSEELMNWLQEKTGFGTIAFADLHHRGRQNTYSWRVFGGEALLLLKLVAAYLLIKKAQAAIAMRFQENTHLRGEDRRVFGRRCSDSIKLLNSRQAWLQNVGNASLS